MSVAIIYCQVFEREVDSLVRHYPEVTIRKCLEWGLHIQPERLAAAMAEEIRAIQDRVSAVVLGYGHCQAMDKLPTDFRVPVFYAQAEDCIGVLLGAEGYQQAKDHEIGTFFLSPGWADMGTEGIFTHFQCSSERCGSRDEALGIARLMLENYRRLLFIDLPVLEPSERDRLLASARQMAADLDLDLDETPGNLDLLSDALAQAVEVARQKGLVEGR